MNRITFWFLCLTFILLRAAAPEFCVAQDIERKADVKFVDSSGDAISDVKAYWYHQGKARKIDASDGRGTIATGDGLIAAHAPGYQYSGLVLGNEPTTPLIVKLLKENEAGTEYKTQPLPFSDAQKQQVINDIEEYFWQQLKSKPNDPQVLQESIFTLAKTAPQKTIEFFETNPVKGQLDGLVKQEIIRAIANSDFATAAQIADSIDIPMHRATLLNALIEYGPKDLPESAISAAETEWANSIKRIQQPAMRLGLWATLAAHYVETDRPNLAKKITDRHLAEIEKLSVGGLSGFTKSLFAAVIAVNDPDRAVELIEGLEKLQLNRAYGRIAFFCCRANPDKALELAGKIRPTERAIVGFEHHVKVCHRMAIEQPEVAFKLAASIEDPNQEAWALGLMALRLHESNPARSREALRKAIETITETTGQTKPVNRSLSPSNTLAGLLPIANKIAPEKMEALIWQSVYLVIPRSRWNLGNESKASKVQATAAQIARYDRSIANALAGDQEVDRGMSESRTVANQVALNLDGLPDFLIRLDQAEYARKYRHRKESLKLLTSSEEEFWDSISKPGFLEWPTGRFEDF